MATRSVFSTMLIALLVVGSPASAQQGDESEVWRAFSAGLESGATVEVRLKNGQRVRGAVVPGGADALRLKPYTRVPVPLRTIPFEDVDSIERWKEGMTPGIKTLIGIGIGVGATILIAFAVLFAAGY